MLARPWNLTFTRQAQNTRLNMAAMVVYNETNHFRNAFHRFNGQTPRCGQKKNSFPPFSKREIA